MNPDRGRAVHSADRAGNQACPVDGVPGGRGERRPGAFRARAADRRAVRKMLGPKPANGTVPARPVRDEAAAGQIRPARPGSQATPRVGT